MEMKKNPPKRSIPTDVLSRLEYVHPKAVSALMQDNDEIDIALAERDLAQAFFELHGGGLTPDEIRSLSWITKGHSYGLVRESSSGGAKSKRKLTQEQAREMARKSAAARKRTSKRSS